MSVDVHARRAASAGSLSINVRISSFCQRNSAEPSKSITVYRLVDPVVFHEAVPPIGLVVNSVGFAFIIAMAATSFDRTAGAVS